MPDFSVRSSLPEIMDDLGCSGEVVHQTLRELEFINRWLGGNAVTLSGLDTLLRNNVPRDTTWRIADLGCGSGEMLRIIAQWAARRRIEVNLTGIDANPNIIRYARNNLHDMREVSLIPIDIFSKEFQERSFDVVIGTLFFHHFNHEELVSFFSRLKEQVRVGVIINDIHRHFLAYHSIRILTKFFSRSGMVKYDAPLSVLRAFTREELMQIMADAGITGYTIRWRWAFRWQVVIRAGKSA